jgi:excisionase family DNA binding protein
VATNPSETVTTPRRPVSIRRAAEILGVNQATLRQWTDAGKVQAFTTPGGHRRFFEDELISFIHTRSDSALQPRLAEILLGCRERYEALVRHCLAESSWFQAFDDLARRRFRILGSSMLSLIGAYLTGGRRERDRSLEEGREVASEYGAEAARLGLSLSEATEAFLLFRTPVLEGLNRWLRDLQPHRRQADALARRANHFMDQVLLSMATSHDAYSANQRAEARP